MFKKHRSPIGSRPGTITVPKNATATTISIIVYTEQEVVERSINVEDLQSVASSCPDKSVLWINVIGLGDAEVLKQLGDQFGIHRLALEDVVNIPHRPKAEPYDQQTFVVSQMVTMSRPPHVETEQVSIFIGESWVITIQERAGDVLEPIRKRIRSGKGRIRQMGSQYLGYAIVDTLIDTFYPLFEKLGEHLEQLEDRLMTVPTKALLEELYAVRREVLVLRHLVYAFRELTNALIEDENDFNKEQLTVFLRDCYDHCVQLIDVADSYRDLCSSLMDLYLSSQSSRMNEVMKVLTIISTIFIPLSFLAGIYGMNFVHMPELGFKWSYPIFWIVILSAAVAMLSMFRRAGWLGAQENRKKE
jgi:magnesium transporter